MTVRCSDNRMNGEMSEYLSDLLEAAINALGSSESIGTEDLLSIVDKGVNRMLKLGYPTGEVFIGSLDVKALYPSLHTEKTAKICARIFAKIGGIHWGWVTTYIELIYNKNEIKEFKLEDLPPIRITRVGQNAPTMLTIDSKDIKPSWRPQKPIHEYTPSDKSRLLEAMMAKMIMTMFKKDFYRWKGQIHHKAKEGPIGLRASGVSANLVMEDWLGKFREVLKMNGIDICVLTK